MFDWIRSQQTGCVYAEKLASNAEIPHWRTLEVGVEKSQDELDGMQEVLRLSAQSDDTDAAVVVFRGVELPEHLPQLVSRLVASKAEEAQKAGGQHVSGSFTERAGAYPY